MLPHCHPNEQLQRLSNLNNATANIYPYNSSSTYCDYSNNYKNPKIDEDGYKNHRMQFKLPNTKKHQYYKLSKRTSHSEER